MNVKEREDIININQFNRNQLDGKHSFFYDESGNIRKFKIVEQTKNSTDGAEWTFNNPVSQDFILGGLMIEQKNQRELPKIDELIQSLNLQKTVAEIKSKHIIGKADFLTTLKSDKLCRIFSWIEDNNIRIHFRSCNYFYYGLVDIIDECHETAAYDIILTLGGLADINFAKNALWKAFIENINNSAQMLYRFSYPNVGEARTVEFYNAVKNLCNKSRSLNESEHMILDLIFNEMICRPSCVLLRGNRDLEMQRTFAEFYIEPVELFCNSSHIFDEELSIADFMKLNFEHISDFKSVQYEFINSKTCRSIQISDVLVGFLGKFFHYINSLHSFETFRENWESINKSQKKLFIAFSNTLLHSMDTFPALTNRVQPIQSKFLLEKCLRYVSCKRSENS